MPVSPQDFDLYSRVTGTPMPSDAMSRMRMAPDVYKFTKDFARKPNLLEKTGNLIKSAGRNTLVGAGMLAGMDLENQERQRQELMRNEASKEAVAETNMDESPEQVVVAPELTAIEKGEIAKQETARIKTNEMIKLEEVRAKLRQKNQEKAEQIETYSIPTSQEPLKDPSTIDYISKKTGENMHDYYREKTKIIDDLDAKQESLRQQPTTSDTYGQDYVPNQSAANIVDRSLEQGSEMADETPTVSEVLSESQDSQPADDMIGSSASSKKVSGFLGKFKDKKSGKLKIDPLLFALAEDAKPTEERVDDSFVGPISSPLNDHVDVKGGEDDSGVPGQQNEEVRGMSTGSTIDLSDHHKEMRQIEALERAAEKSPSTKQIALSEMNKSREGFMAQDGPNKPAYDARQRVLKKTAEKRAKSVTDKSDNYIEQVMKDLNDPDAMMDKPEIVFKTSRAGRQEVGLTQGGDYFEVYKNNPQKTYITRLEPIEAEAFEAMAGSEINDDKEKRPDASKFLDHFKNLRQQEQL